MQYSDGVRDLHESVEDRLPRPIDEANRMMSLKDEYQQSAILRMNLSLPTFLM